ncbi:hypothetical protein ONZ45_g13532 [Pleurotus djamor]|nr:hypothetical protein ONZ45_g13532 [Pleurotus djamor]
MDVQTSQPSLDARIEDITKKIETLVVSPLLLRALNTATQPSTSPIASVGSGNETRLPPEVDDSQALSSTLRSMRRFFPALEVSFLQEVVTHEFRPYHIGKLIASFTSPQKTLYNVTQTDEGIVLSVVEPPLLETLPTFAHLTRALSIYFDILIQFNVLTTKDATIVAHISHCSSKYLRMLTKYAEAYPYPALLEYHSEFHCERLVDMMRGDYSKWMNADMVLFTTILEPALVKGRKPRRQA